MGELEWFDAYCKLDNAPGAAEETLELIRKAESDVFMFNGFKTG